MTSRPAPKNKANPDGQSAADGTKAPRQRSRLAGALRSIRAEAARALEHEPAPRRLAGTEAGALPPWPPLERGLSPEERASLCEVEDGQGRLLLCMNEHSALRQGLPLCLVACAPRLSGRGRLVLHKGGGGRALPAKWSIHVGPLRPGEAKEEAALRLLEQEAEISGVPVRLLAQTPAGGGLRGPLSLYAADLPAGIYPRMPGLELLEVDEDELQALARRDPELLSPELLLAALGGTLFR